MATVKVYPTHPDALNIGHPINGKLRVSGSDWEMDGFTSRMLTDGIITKDETKGWKSTTAGADLSKPPAHATGDSAKPPSPATPVAPVTPPSPATHAAAFGSKEDTKK